MNNDELQKAIDDITKDNAVPAAPVPGAAENEALADEIAGPAEVGGAPLPPAMPETETVGADVADFDVPAAPAPDVPNVPSMPPTVSPLVDEKLEPSSKVVNKPEEIVNERVETVAPATDEATLNEALRELYPLLDKVEMPIQEKFDIALKFGEPARALEYAKMIEDDSAKAEALLAIVNKLK